jgi:hypothetical protein
VSKRRTWALIALVWIAAAFACYLLTAWPAFRHLYALEQFPLGMAAGWIGRSAVQRHAGRRKA